VVKDLGQILRIKELRFWGIKLFMDDSKIKVQPVTLAKIINPDNIAYSLIVN
jgi:hypothetical protein